MKTHTQSNYSQFLHPTPSKKKKADSKIKKVSVNKNSKKQNKIKKENIKVTSLKENNLVESLKSQISSTLNSHTKGNTSNLQLFNELQLYLTHLHPLCITIQ